MVPSVLLALIELGLRVARLGYSPDFFIDGQSQDRPAIIDNQQFGKRFFPPALVRFPHSFALPTVKPPETLRVFVLGESAAMGDPDARFGLPRMLEVLLQDRFPRQRVQVVNAAMVAINSHVVRTIAQETLREQADLWVIYMGNNEMIGPFGALSAFGSQAPRLPLTRAIIGLKRFRLVQLLDQVVRSPASRQHRFWGGMAMWGDQQLRRDDPLARQVHQSFRRNLEDIVAAGCRAGVPIVLCTVATNLKDCAPFGSLHSRNLNAAQIAQWQAAFDQGVALESQAKFSEAAQAYETARALDGHFAELAFRLGRCWLALGKLDQAAQCFATARNEDTLPFRTDDDLNESIRAVAAQHDGLHRVRLLDAARLLAAASLDGIPGLEYFYEHVHLNPDGNFLLASAVADAAAETLARSPNPPHSPTPAPLSKAACLEALGFTEWNRHQILTRMLEERIGQAPFTSQANHAEHLRVLHAELERCRGATKPIQVQRAVRLAAQAVARRPDDPDLRWNLAQLLDAADDLPAAEQAWRTVIRFLPHASLPHFNLGKVLHATGRSDEARRCFKQCLLLDPNNLEARRALGQTHP